MTEIQKNPIGLLSGSTLKLIGCILMAIDHIGYHLFPEVLILRVIGRLSMPIFAFMIAEGCHYTKNKLKHFLLIFISGIIFLLGVRLFDGSWFGNIFLQFSISILYIYLLEFLKKLIFKSNHKILMLILSILIFVVTLIPGTYLFKIFRFDYDFFVTLLPVAVSIFYLKDYSNHKVIKYIDNLYVKLLITTIILIVVCFNTNYYHPLQWHCLLAIPLLLLYNEKPGCKKMKYFFYLFYPAHIATIIGIKILLTMM